MSVELQVIRASEFICLDADEHQNFEASKKSLQGLAQACLKRGLDCALLDLRGLPVLSKPHFNKKEVAALVGAFCDAGFSHKQRLAVLYEHDVYGIIRDFTSLSKTRGLQVESFLDHEKAMSWLSGHQESPPELERGAQVPIVKRHAKKRPGLSRNSRTRMPRAARGNIKGTKTSRLTPKRRA